MNVDYVSWRQQHYVWKYVCFRQNIEISDTIQDVSKMISYYIQNILLFGTEWCVGTIDNAG